MKTLAGRRWRNIILFIVIAVAILVFFRVAESSLVPIAYATGWTLLALCVVLALYNVRKKVAFLPLIASATWLQFHIYLGLVSMVVFMMHAGFALPTGPLEWLLGSLYVAVAGSGVIGLLLTRTLPPRLNTRGENIIYERLPVIRAQLREQAEELVVGSVGEGNVTAIADLYRDRLLDFFLGPRNFWSHLFGSARPRHALLTEIQTLGRFLKEPDRRDLDRMADLVSKKDDLDYRAATFGVLRYWLFVHIPLTYGLLIVAAVHVVVVHAFSGGAR